MTDTLDCCNCKKISPVNEMFTVDACSEKCQNELETTCKICKGRFGKSALRFYVCWSCATAESIIEEGKDMFDKGDAKTSMEKVELLLKRGWRNELPKQEPHKHKLKIGRVGVDW